MRITDLAGKNVCILGYGKEGRAMAEALEMHAPNCAMTIADRDEKLTSDRWPLITGPDYLAQLKKFDFVIKSPGIPPLPEFTMHAKSLTSPTKIFFDTIKGSGAKVVGVTGSKGKSTTASLIHHIVKANGLTSILVGNIGDPAIAHVDDAKEGTIFVFELSSYQLLDLDASPDIAVVTSFFPEHLDYHGSLAPYLEAKKHITRFQKKEDHVYFNSRFATCKEIAKESPGHKHPFSDIDTPVLIDEIKLKGAHNLGNVAAAFLVARQLGVSRSVAVDAIKSFVPLRHRLESLGAEGGIEWVNDSISTTPESAVAALAALGDRVKVLILGGQDRGYDFSPLIHELKRSKVEAVILLPDGGKTIGALIKAAGLPMTCVTADTMEQAVAEAKKHVGRETERTPIVLLSPASPSYGHFKNFEDRGDQFRKAILA